MPSSLEMWREAGERVNRTEVGVSSATNLVPVHVQVDIHVNKRQPVREKSLGKQ
jgi:hypothetical protein